MALAWTCSTCDMALATTLRRGRSLLCGTRSTSLARKSTSTPDACAEATRTNWEDVPEHLYHKQADETLEKMQEALDEYIESHDVPEGDVEYGMGVLTLRLGSKGTYVYNKQAPNRQIWSSSPISGPVRYDLVREKWIYLRDGHEMLQRLSSELKDLFGTKLDVQ